MNVVVVSLVCHEDMAYGFQVLCIVQAAGQNGC